MVKWRVPSAKPVWSLREWDSIEWICKYLLSQQTTAKDTEKAVNSLTAGLVVKESGIPSLEQDLEYSQAKSSSASPVWSLRGWDSVEWICKYLLSQQTIAKDPEKAENSLPGGLVVKESGIPGAGLGVWSSQEFPARALFGSLLGVRYCWMNL